MQKNLPPLMAKKLLASVQCPPNNVVEWRVCMIFLRMLCSCVYVNGEHACLLYSFVESMWQMVPVRGS